MSSWFEEPRRTSTSTLLQIDPRWVGMSGGLKFLYAILILEAIPTKGRMPNKSVPVSCSTAEIECTLSSSASATSIAQAPKNKPAKMDMAR